MNIINLCIIALVGIITAVVLKGYKQEYSVLVVITLSFIFLAVILKFFGEMREQIGIIVSELGQNKPFYKILFKILGITYLCEFSAGICKDAGYSSIAAQIEIIGKMIIFLSGIPVFVSVIETIRNYKI